MTPVPLPVQVLLAVLVVTAAAYDIRFRRIPNWLVLLGLASGLGANAATGGWGGLMLAAGGFALAFGAYLVLHLLRAMGAGDVKLMGAVGSLVGYANWIPVFIFTSLLGGLAALILVTVRGRLRRTLWNVCYILGEFMHFRAPYMRREDLDVKSEKAVTLPHGAAIAGGSIAFLLAQRFFL